MAKKETGPKMEYETEYVVPLRQGWLKVPVYKRANKAVKTLKEFIARHMKVYDRDLRKIKVDVDLNNELRFRGMTKPPAKIKVKASRFDNNTVIVSLVDLPKHLEFRNKRAEKMTKSKSDKSDSGPKDPKKIEPTIKPVEDKKDESPAEEKAAEKKEDVKKETKKKEEKTKK